MSGESTVIRLATRGSPLALAQARIVGDLLSAAWGDRITTELVVVDTAGDRSQHVPIHAIGGQGVFVKEVDAAVMAGRAEVAIHSAKDLPSSADGETSGTGASAAGEDATATRIVAVPKRADPRDALVGMALADLRPGARVATGSVRRRAQLAWLRPDLMFTELRGNVATRLAKVPEGGAVVVAMAALVRLGWEDRASETLSVTSMLPQVGQGAIAVCARPDDDGTATWLAAIEDPLSRIALEAERAYLRGVGGGCDLPVGAYAVVGEDGSIELEAIIASLDGHTLVREKATGTVPEAVGTELARRILDGAGGRSLLEHSDAGAPPTGGAATGGTSS
ncbi:MAG: hydroxymethylbilane synthase [Acidimicrobiales bacterium]